MVKSYDLISFLSTAKFGKIVAQMVRHGEEYLTVTNEEEKKRALMYAEWRFGEIEPLLRGRSIVVDGIKFAKKHLPLSNEVKFSIKRVKQDE